MERGLGEKFIEALKKNDETVLSEDYENEPIIALICNYMKVRKWEEVYEPTSSFYDKLMKNRSLFPGGSSNYYYENLPKTPATFSKKINSLKGIFAKYDIDIRIERSNDARNISYISIAQIEHKSDTKELGKNVKKNRFKRVPIVGIRKAIKIDKKD